MMKILNVVPTYVPAYRHGGSIIAVRELCKSLVRKGLDVSLFTTNTNMGKDFDIPLNEPQDVDGVKVTYHAVAFPRLYYYSPPLYRTLENRIREFDLVHIHSVYLYPTYIAARLCRLYEIPYILNPFGALDPAMIHMKSRVKKTLYIKLVEKNNIKMASGIHVASLYEKRSFDSLGFNKPSFIIPPAIDLAEYPKSPGFSWLREKYPALATNKIILFLGRIHPKKGLDLLAESFKAVCRERDDVFLVIAGHGEIKYVDQIKFLFKDKGLSHRVIFTGELLGREKLSAFYESDIFVLPSHGENFGIAALEAMACALPVVVSDTVGLAADIKESGSGAVTACRPEDITKAIFFMLDNEEIRKGMGKAGRGLVESRFTNDRIADKVVSIYKEILGR